jgi:hypothetical protein
MEYMINLNAYQTSDSNSSTSSEHSNNSSISDELGAAIQSLIQQLRKAPLH